MNNSEIELELIQHFGLDKTIDFCEMNAFLYDLLYKEHCENCPKDITDLDYDAEWWKIKHDELLKRKVMTI